MRARCGSVAARALHTSAWVASGHDRIDILKLDIEGAEYEALDDILAGGVRPTQLLVEFHHRVPGIGVEPTRQAVARLNAAGYRVFSVPDDREKNGVILSSRGSCLDPVVPPRTR